jgi:hypothetical protein
MGEDQKTLLRYLRARHPGAGFTVTHAESGCIPLGFAPPRTSGPRHILLGTKRGLIKPSAGYGVVRIAAESEHLARLWRENRPLPPSRRSAWWWRFLDTGFLRLGARSTPALGPATARHGRGSPRPIAALHRRRSRASTVAPACTDGPTSRPRQENVVAEDGTSAGDTVSRFGVPRAGYQGGASPHRSGTRGRTSSRFSRCYRRETAPSRRKRAR